jgi:hypothetical protein
MGEGRKNSTIINSTIGDDPKTDPGDNNSAGELPEVSNSEKEIGGRDGPDPTRYGDWEKAGRCIDF